MLAVFRRTGSRRYAVEIRREDFPDVEMNPAPGFDPHMPHDLMHLVVEAQLGLKRGIYGQLAAGGTAGTFHVAIKSDESSRALSRTATRVRSRGKKLMKKGRDDCDQSERAAFICWQEWTARSSSKAQTELPQTMAELNKRKLDEICRHLDELSSKWSNLKVGESMTVRWPDLAIVENSPAVVGVPEGEHERGYARNPQ